MNNRKVLFYVFKWVVLVLLTFLVTNEVHSEARKILVFLLVVIVAAGLIIEGWRNFYPDKRKK